MKRLFALALCVALAAPGCATTTLHQRRDQRAPDTTPATTARLLADYIRQIPVGSRVRITEHGGRVLRATLMRNDGDPIVVQRRARIPEPPIELPIVAIAAVELDAPTNSNVGRNIAIGAAAAAGATLGVLALIAAIVAD